MSIQVPKVKQFLKVMTPQNEYKSSKKKKQQRQHLDIKKNGTALFVSFGCRPSISMHFHVFHTSRSLLFCHRCVCTKILHPTYELGMQMILPPPPTPSCSPSSTPSSTSVLFQLQTQAKQLRWFELWRLTRRYQEFNAAPSTLCRLLLVRVDRCQLKQRYHNDALDRKLLGLVKLEIMLIHFILGL